MPRFIIIYINDVKQLGLVPPEINLISCLDLVMEGKVRFNKICDLRQCEILMGNNSNGFIYI